MGNAYIENTIEECEKRIKLLNKRLNKLYEDRTDGIITEDFYCTKRDEWQQELDELLVKFDKSVSSNRTLIQDADEIIELCKNAHGLYLSQPDDKKAELMKLLTIELLFDGRNIELVPHSAFENLIKFKNCKKLETAGVEPASKVDKSILLRV